MKKNPKIISVQSLRRKLPLLRKKGYEVAFTNGCFDIIHAGHVTYLQAAKRKKRVLIVGLNSDRSVKMIKGPNRPIVPQKQRALVLAAFACVDFVTIFNEPTPEKIIGVLKPDVLIKGADWKGKEVAGSVAVLAAGGKVEFIDYVASCSSTNIIKTILAQCKK